MIAPCLEDRYFESHIADGHDLLAGANLGEDLIDHRDVPAVVGLSRRR